MKEAHGAAIQSTLIKMGYKISLFEDWAEILAFIALIVAFIISLSAPSAVLSYIIIFFCGIMAGRIWYKRKEKLKFPYFLIIVAFLIGYILGDYYGNKITIIILFIAGLLVSYYLHEKNYIR